VHLRFRIERLSSGDDHLPSNGLKKSSMALSSRPPSNGCE
jgi:hypothetical protein